MNSIVGHGTVFADSVGNWLGHKQPEAQNFVPTRENHLACQTCGPFLDPGAALSFILQSIPNRTNNIDNPHAFRQGHWLPLVNTVLLNLRRYRN